MTELIGPFLAVLLTADGPEVGAGIASMYRPWQVSATVPYGRYPGAWRTKPTPDDLVCAHRTIRFGTYLRLTNTKTNRQAVCVVLDRGPWGACVRSKGAVQLSKCKRGFKYKVARRKPRHGYWRGIIDATPAVHDMMQSKGWTFVRVERLGVPASRRVLRRSSAWSAYLAFVGCHRRRDQGKR